MSSSASEPAAESAKAPATESSTAEATTAESTETASPATERSPPPKPPPSPPDLCNVVDARIPFISTTPTTVLPLLGVSEIAIRQLKSWKFFQSST
jgi:hypothetical protein